MDRVRKINVYMRDMKGGRKKVICRKCPDCERKSYSADAENNWLCSNCRTELTKRDQVEMDNNVVEDIRRGGLDERDYR